LLVVFVAADSSAQNRFHRRRGALLGGLAGAAIGAAIGDKGDNETAGALIGGAVGAVAGGSIGDQKDRRIEHNMQYHSGHHHHHNAPPQYQTYPYHVYPEYVQPQPVYPSYRQPYYPETITPPLTNAPVSPDDVVAMTRSGLSDVMIIQQIQMKGVSQQLTVNDVIQLHRLGVREPVISAMQGVIPIQTPDTMTNGNLNSIPSDHPGLPQPYSSDETIYRVPTTQNEVYGPSILNPPQP
tara:strand:+ start:222351 stop:223067 length:717 start_codon:yes stop_codon:yes gene_type:complete